MNIFTKLLSLFSSPQENLEEKLSTNASLKVSNELKGFLENEVLDHGVAIGNDCLIHANTVIGSDGFGFAPTSTGWEKILQLGGVKVGDRVEIGAGCAIDRGALEDTQIGDDVILDNLVHIAHGVKIGRGSAVAGQVGFAGGSELGERCTVGGQAGFAGHLKIANDVRFDSAMRSILGAKLQCVRVHSRRDHSSRKGRL